MTNEWIDFDDVRSTFETALTLPAFPDEKEFPKYKEGDVIDEEKSVRWNREEVQRRMKVREDKTKELRKERNDRIHEAEDMAKRYIIYWISCGEAQADVIWRYIYDENHDNMNILYDQLEKIVDLFKEFNKAGKES